MTEQSTADQIEKLRDSFTLFIGQRNDWMSREVARWHLEQTARFQAKLERRDAALLLFKRLYPRSEHIQTVIKRAMEDTK